MKEGIELGVKLRDHFGDMENITFKDLKIFWEFLYHSLIDEGITIESEENFIEQLTDNGKLEYLDVKSSNPDWEFPSFLNK